MTMQTRAIAAGLDGVTFWLLTTAFVLSALHIADHVLRVDHSGWPFRPEVTPFTFSLLAFPMLLFALFGSRRLYWWRWSLLLAAIVATVFAHVAIETPPMQFAMWAHNQSSDPHQQGFQNIPHMESPTLGIVAMILAMALNVTAVTSTIAMLAQGLRTKVKALR